jgi:hypothetical protein
MTAIVTRPHMRHANRFVPEDKKRRVQYDMDKRREEQGKKVVHLHEQPPAPKCSMPGDAEMAPRILAYFEQHGRTPDRILIPFVWPYHDHGFAVPGLPPHEDDLSGRYGRTGRWVRVAVEHSPNAQGVTLV